jgi:hypothetical protein
MPKGVSGNGQAGIFQVLLFMNKMTMSLQNKSLSYFHSSPRIVQGFFLNFCFLQYLPIATNISCIQRNSLKKQSMMPWNLLGQQLFKTRKLLMTLYGSFICTMSQVPRSTGIIYDYYDKG